MALIECPECEEAVSEHAHTCVHCGYPVSGYDPQQAALQVSLARGGNGSHVTVENTKKSIKLVMLICSLAMLVCVGAALTGFSWGWPAAGVMFACVVMSKVVRWWEHG